ncbi:putative tRNA adenosine deaminase-associated protein [Allocatelliglobosispora scoriae]|uniref:Putative tRNA adenosine deaminase-associated protein n=1 Tax=Allocatelliglobosispora scoriae TaxID=643052 RepID=A0A841BW71_9ACTN|nr:tRNA adenosine deaminase-associated protein [Allocatelliglobosispora scoriae]MBB5871173.1 putative tRNA adenosine deaminase-associated protein [Allocatelliglobosispora scoriae]
MSYFAAAVTRGRSGWTASELDLSDVADVDQVADLMRDVDPDALVSLLFIEADDAYLTVLRLDDGEDLRVFGSDAAYADDSRLGKLLIGDVTEPATEAAIDGDLDDLEPVVAADDDEDPPVVDPTATPIGDADLLADLGVSAHKLLALCATDGLLPADVTAEVCQAIGCGDEVEELREA